MKGLEKLQEDYVEISIYFSDDMVNLKERLNTFHSFLSKWTNGYIWQKDTWNLQERGKNFLQNETSMSILFPSFFFLLLLVLLVLVLLIYSFTFI